MSGALYMALGAGVFVLPSFIAIAEAIENRRAEFALFGLWLWCLSQVAEVALK